MTKAIVAMTTTERAAHFLRYDTTQIFNRNTMDIFDGHAQLSNEQHCTMTKPPETYGNLECLLFDFSFGFD